MKATTCIEAFAEGKADSQKYPRTQGAYKLGERRQQSNESVREVGRICNALKFPSSRQNLMHCTFDDKALWLREILKITAHELSESVIPSFRALTGDGMAQAQVDQHLPYVERRCQEVLQGLERARQTTKGRIQDEYDRMRHGDSVVGDALAHAREMLEEIISLTPPDIRRQIYGPVEEVI
jgi:hypothetical protein